MSYVCENIIIMDELTISQKIDIGRVKKDITQDKLVELLVEAGLKMNTSKFSIKKKYNDFTDEEISVLSNILGATLVND